MRAERRRPGEATTKLLSGWGGTARTGAVVTEPDCAGEVRAAIADAGPRGVIARGLGRSYGDAAQNAGGTVVVTTGLDRLLDLDLDRAVARVESGVSLDWLMRTLVPLGLWPVVSPGTRQVTVGGAIGSDIHGKNHHRDGTWTAHVQQMVIDTPAYGPVEASPDDPSKDPELFWATAGGMGLTGVILEATISLLSIETATMRVVGERIPDLDALMSKMVAADAHHQYSVAWVDCLARGRSLGRSVLELGDHARRDELPLGRRSTARALEFRPYDRAVAPPWAPPRLLNRWTVAAFNEAWFRKASKTSETHLVSAGSFFHPLDLVSGWNRVYGRHGFLQYQMVVPDGEEETLRRSIEALADARCTSFVNVLKRFGAANPAPLSFPRPGWTLAIDMPASAEGLTGLLDRLDEMVVSAGGRVYLAKDSRLRPDLLAAMYPELARWQAVRARVDPEGRLRSDLARRLPALGPVGGTS